MDAEGKQHQAQGQDAQAQEAQAKQEGNVVDDDDVAYPPDDDDEDEDLEDEEEPDVPGPSNRQGNGNGGRRGPPPCLLCGSQAHWATQCRQFGTMATRRAQMRKLGKCERCTWQAHRGACGPQTPACYYCKQAGRYQDSRHHHAVLCPYIWY